MNCNDWLYAVLFHDYLRKCIYHRYKKDKQLILCIKMFATQGLNN